MNDFPIIRINNQKKRSRIRLLSANYPSLSKLELFNFDKEIVSHCFRGKTITCSDLFKDEICLFNLKKKY
jgi:hypothetical protein